MNDQARSASETNVWSIVELNAFLATERDRYLSAASFGSDETPVDQWDPPLTNPLEADFNPLGPSIIISPACPVFPVSQTRTNNKFLFLSEVGGAPCLKSFLDSVIAGTFTGTHGGGTLIIDQLVTLTEPIRIPQHFTLAGVGINGAGRLKFEGNFKNIPAITIEEGGGGTGGKVVLRDITIEGPDGANVMNGLKLGTTQFVHDKIVESALHALGRFQLHRVRISGFGGFGIQGGLHAYSVWIDDCELIKNRTQIQLVAACNSWRIRDCLIKEATEWGIEVGHSVVFDFPDPADEKLFPNPQPGSLTDTLISGCKFQGNRLGAIVVRKNSDENNPPFGVFIYGNSFRQNGDGNKQIAISVEHSHMGTRIVSNLFHKSQVVGLPTTADEGSLPMEAAGVHPLSTHLGFNVALGTTEALKTMNRLVAPYPKGVLP